MITLKEFLAVIEKAFIKHYADEQSNSKSNDCDLGTNKSEFSDLFKKTFSVEGVSFAMIYVTGGVFDMGDDERKNTHVVNLNSYWIGETVVTQELWRVVMGYDSPFAGSGSFPANNVSLKQCNKFVKRLNQKTGKSFRLLTEAEWEYAARGGNRSKGYRYSGSDDLDSVGWYLDNSGSKMHKVKMKLPNELGLYDMSGNVREWCSDIYGEYDSDLQTNPTGAKNGKMRVMRGGGWNSYESACRVWARGCNHSNSGHDNYGLRLGLTMRLKSAKIQR